MNSNNVSFGFMIAGAIISFIIAWRYPRRKELIAPGFITGFIIAAANMLMEYLGARFDVYHISGPWTVVNTPLPLTVGWFFFTFIYCSIYRIIIKRGRWRWRVHGYIGVGIINGCLIDYFLYKYAGILSLGKNGNAGLILMVWLTFVPLTIFLYEFIAGYLLAGANKR